MVEHGKFSEQPVSLELGLFVESMNEELRNVENTGMPYEFIREFEAYAGDLMDAGVVQTFADIEKGLRTLGSRVFLIARPLVEYPMSATIYPGTREGSPEYSLFVGTGGQILADGLLRTYKLDADENLARLETTGVVRATRAE